MEHSREEWVRVISYENLPASPHPGDALAAWLRRRGIDWMPFADAEIRMDLACGQRDDGHWSGTYGISIRADSLRRLGLHPDQPTASC